MASKAEFLARHGRDIYIYNNISTNQVVFSLKRTIKNKKAMKQFLFMGKNSVPTHIRKDLWTPLASVHFPRSDIGLKVYNHLRQFKLLQETQWEDESLWRLDKKTKRRPALMDQKTKTIAGLADALSLEIGKTELAEDVVVRWKNIYDAEYSENWPDKVVHDTMPEGVKYTAPYPEGQGPPGKETGEEVVVQL